jgi:hypothetical protein
VEMAKKASLYYNQKNPNGKKHQKKGAWDHAFKWGR